MVRNYTETNIPAVNTRVLVRLFDIRHLRFVFDAYSNKLAFAHLYFPIIQALRTTWSANATWTCLNSITSCLIFRRSFSIITQLFWGMHFGATVERKTEDTKYEALLSFSFNYRAIRTMTQHRNHATSPARSSSVSLSLPNPQMTSVLLLV